jgi:peptidase E
MDLHLFSSPGEGDIAFVVDACRPYLRGTSSPLLAYVPAGTAPVASYYAHTRDAFNGLADVALLDATTSGLDAFAEVLSRAQAVCLPGGNTYLMSQRLHRHGYCELLRRYASAGLPVIAFSAGTVFCGLSLLTSNDTNDCGTRQFSGLELVPCSFNVHYPADDLARAQRDRFLQSRSIQDAHPLLALEDGAYLRATDARVTLARGSCWLFRKGQSRRVVPTGIPLDLLHVG